MDMRRLLAVIGTLALATASAAAQDLAPTQELEARIWLDRGDEPLLQRGERVRLYYRTSMDAYVAIFQIDTDGSARLLYPQAPDEDHYIRAARDYRLLFPQSSYWYVDEYPGKGYFFVIASPEPFDFSEFDYARYDRGWDLTQVGRSVYEDPYVAIDDYVARLIPDWEFVPYALDFISYDVGERHDYPRFLCYDCHGFRTYAAWNPYTYVCSSFRVVIWDDPYFYPSYRYGGTRVVYSQPRRGLPRFEFKERARGEAWTPLTRTRQPPLRRAVRSAEPSAANPARPRIVPPRRRVVPSEALRNGSSGSRSWSSSGVQAPVRRDGMATDGSRDARTVRPAQPRTVTPGRSTGGRATTTTPRSGARPTLQRRPSSSRNGTGGRTGVAPTRGSSPSASGTRGRTVVPSRSGSAKRPTTAPGRSRARAPTRSPSRSPAAGSRGPTRTKRPSVRSRGTSGGSKAVRPTRPPPRRKPGLR